MRPRQFRWSGVEAGIRKHGGLDVALLVSDRPALAAGVYTQNAFAAAPVLLTRRRSRRYGALQAIVANAGNANACTGEDGPRDARSTGRAVARALGLAERQVGICSTGVIGQRLPAERISAAVPAAVQALSADPAAFAQAILTTDTHPKIARSSVGPAAALGVAKGAGMIQPKMATMLAFVATDAVVADAAALRASLRRVADRTFNRVTVDGDTSTNDTLLVLANGAAGGPALADDALDSLLFEVCDPLARALAEDGEGATKLVHVHVRGARTEGEADAAARAVANSPLVKTALFAADANWGRIVCAVGNSGARVSTDRVALTLDAAPLLSQGRWLGPEAEAAVTEVMKGREYTLSIDLAVPGGAGEATVHTCDFSYDYVKINAEYRT